MTQKAYEKWLADPKIGLSRLNKDLKNKCPFGSSTLEEELAEYTGYKTKGKEKLTINKAIARWLYDLDHKDLFTEALPYQYSFYPNFIHPVHKAIVRTGDRNEDEASLYLSRTRNKIVALISTDWPLPSEKNVEVIMYRPEDFTLERAIYRFEGEVQDFALMGGEFKVAKGNVEEYKAQGRIGGSIAYESYIPWIKPTEKAFILI